MENDNTIEMIVDKMKEVTFTWDITVFSFEDGQFMSGYTVSRLYNGNILRVSS